MTAVITMASTLVAPLTAAASDALTLSLSGPGVARVGEAAAYTGRLAAAEHVGLGAQRVELLVRGEVVERATTDLHGYYSMESRFPAPGRYDVQARSVGNGLDIARSPVLEVIVPLDVVVHADETRATTQIVGIDGGALYASAADGSASYALEIPPGALLSDTEMTMAPVMRIDGLPLSGGLVGAVRLEPDGLQLAQPARLRIWPRAAVPVAERVGFSSHGSGRDFHMHPVDPSATPWPEVALHISHFSTPGAGRGTDDDVRDQSQRPPASLRDQYDQRAAEIVRRWANGDPSAEDEFLAFARDWFRDLVLPLLQAAAEDETLASEALSALFGFDRQMQLMGLAGDLDAELQQARQYIEQVMNNAVEKAYRRCVGTHDIRNASSILAWLRFSSLMGVGDESTAAGINAKWEDCIRFELRMSSVLERRLPDGSQWHLLRVDARVPIERLVEGWGGSMEYKGASGEGFGRDGTREWSFTGATRWAGERPRAAVSADSSKYMKGVGPPVVVVDAFRPGEVLELKAYDPGHDRDGVTEWTTLWTATALSLWGSFGGYVPEWIYTAWKIHEPLEFLGGALWARGYFERNGGWDNNGKFTFELYHTPTGTA